jgi:hypothetical protein
MGTSPTRPGKTVTEALPTPAAVRKAEQEVAAHRKRQDESRVHVGPDCLADLDLIFANPNGTPLKPDSVSASVSLLCRRLGLPKGVSFTRYATATGRCCWRMAWTWQPCRNAWATPQSA